VQAFFKTYYNPANAVLVVVGDIEPPAVAALVDKYFAPIAGAPPPPPVDVSEPRQDKEKRASKVDKLAPRPALAIGYHMPRRGHAEAFAMEAIDKILADGSDSLLYQSLVQKARPDRRDRHGDQRARKPLELPGPDDAGRDPFPRRRQEARRHPGGDRRGGGQAAERPRRRRTRSAAPSSSCAPSSTTPSRRRRAWARSTSWPASRCSTTTRTRSTASTTRSAKVTPELVLAVAKEYLRPTNGPVITVEVAK